MRWNWGLDIRLVRGVPVGDTGPSANDHHASRQAGWGDARHPALRNRRAGYQGFRNERVQQDIGQGGRVFHGAAEEQFP